MPREQYSERPSASVKRPALIWHRDGHRAKEIELRKEQSATIGRDAASTVQIDSGYVSKEHAILSFRGGNWIVEDLESANGTRVNGRPIRVHLDLRPGDKIEIGDTVFEFADLASREAALKTSPSRKFVRLAAVAVGTGVVLISAFLLIGGPSAGSSSNERQSSGPDPVGADVSVQIVDTALINQSVDRAKRTGLSEADVLFDEGMLNLASRRFRDATQLLAAAQARRPQDSAIKGRLVDARQALETSLSEAIAEAALADSQLRRDDARLAWERVVAMTYSNDPRNREAVSRLQKLDEERNMDSRR
jgi:FHA domain